MDRVVADLHERFAESLFLMSLGHADTADARGAATSIPRAARERRRGLEAPLPGDLS